MCSLCTKYKRILLLVSTFLERCFNLGPLPGLWLSAALGLPVGGSFRGGPSQTPQSVMQLQEAYSKFPLPAEWTAIRFYPSLLQTPQAHSKSLVLPLAAGFPGQGINPASPGHSLPLPNFFHSERAGWRQRGKEEGWGQMEEMGLGSGK